jgi:hypothetical protein
LPFGLPEGALPFGWTPFGGLPFPPFGAFGCLPAIGGFFAPGFPAVLLPGFGLTVGFVECGLPGLGCFGFGFGFGAFGLGLGFGFGGFDFGLGVGLGFGLGFGFGFGAGLDGLGFVDTCSALSRLVLAARSLL